MCPEHNDERWLDNDEEEDEVAAAAPAASGAKKGGKKGATGVAAAAAGPGGIKLPLALGKGLTVRRQAAQGAGRPAGASRCAAGSTAWCGGPLGPPSLWPSVSCFQSP
jgi:hypothetical protein